MNNAANVSTAKAGANGAVSTAPAGTTVPTDATTKLDAAFQSLGYIGEDGITVAEETDSEDIKDMDGNTVLKVMTSRDETVQFVAIETNQATLAARYGDENVQLSDSGELKVIHNGKEKPTKPWVLETLMNGNRVRRTVIPNGKLTEVGEQTLKGDEVIGYDMTIAALPDEAGNTAYTYIAAVSK